MNVGVVGTGPATESVAAVLGDERIDIETIESEAVPDVDLAVVVDSVGVARFDAANEAALAATGTEWIAIELGGIGGHALEGVEATVTGFGPGMGCFECLGARVAANADAGERNGEAGSDRIDRFAESGSSSSIGDATTRLAGTIAGRKALRTLAGASVAGVIELPYAERRLLAVPNCRCSPESDRGGRFGGLDRNEEERGLEAALARAERTLDPRVGVVREIGEAASFPVPYYLARLGDTTIFSDARATTQAAGVAADWNAAFMKAIGEGLERYCAGVYRTEDLTRARPTDLDRAITPSEFVRPDSNSSSDPDEPIRWVAGEALTSGSEVLVPAAVALFPPPEERFRPAITTGLGLGNSGIGALLSGLYETIERDATMLGWYSTFEPLGLDVESERFATLEGRAQAVGLSATALLVTQDVDVPVVTVALHREDEWPRFAVGSDADLDAERAAESALAEALQNWIELEGMGEEGATEAAGAIDHYADFPPAARALLDVDRAIPAESVGTEVSGREELETVLDRLADTGLDSYGVRLTTRDVEELGFEAVRVLVPAAQPLFTGEPFFGERARTVPTSLGFEPRLDRDPHPYP
jgi:ribosomal protein S12 methylthiotransferase accessory factor